MRQGIKTDVSNAVQNELVASYEKFPKFVRAHEGYAVIKEEIEEAEVELAQVKSYFDQAWLLIKANHDAKRIVEELDKSAQLMACEAIQVAAMCLKFVDSSKEWRD